MRNIFLIFGLIFAFQITTGQDILDHNSNEFCVSANKTTLKDDNTENRYGFGFGLIHSFLADKKLNILFGVEYNQTNQYKKFMYEGHYATLSGLTYTINSISFPAGLRINLGKTTKVFLETGCFGDINIKSKRTGTLHTSNYDNVNQPVFMDYPIDETVSLSDCFGLYLGLGIRIPISKMELIIKPDYKIGLTNLNSSIDELYNKYFRVSIGLKI